MASDPMPEDKRGWRVAPAPDGRGMPEQHQPRPPHRLRGFWIIFVVLLALHDRVSYSREELEAMIKVALGGRVAEEIVYGKITTGAESDLQQLTRIARQMVGRWGMSEKLGPLTVLPSDGQGPLLPGANETSPQTQWLVDEEVHRMVEDAHTEVTSARLPDSGPR